MLQKVSFAVVLTSLIFTASLCAQEETTPPETFRQPGNVKSTRISFELLTGARGQNLTARQWLDFFQELQIPLRIRQSIREEKPAISEEIEGEVRKIHVVAIVESDGTLKLTAGKVKPGQDERLKTWIGSLREYGALGDPEGKPLWGLSAAQYNFVRSSLSREVETSLTGVTLSDALLKLPLPTDLLLVFSDGAKQLLKDSNIRERQFSEDLLGISLGSSLAILLRDYGLAFEPQRLPNGQIVLEVKLLDQAEKPWPVGWDWEGYPKQIAPRFFGKETIRVQDFTLNEFLDFIEKGTELPIVIDHYSLRSIQLDPAGMQVTLRPDVTAWNLLLNKGLSPLRLRAERRLDEAGTPFLWVTPSPTLIRIRLKEIEAGEIEADDVP